MDSSAAAEPQVLGFVHYCAFCGWRRGAASLTVLSPCCEGCGCSLSSATREVFDNDGLGLDDGPAAPARRADASGAFVMVAAGPFLLPVLGFALGDLLFCIPLVLLVLACVHCLGTAGRRREQRALWLWLAASAALGAAASLLAVVGSVLGAGELPGLYLGATASVALLGAAGSLALRSIAGVRPERLVDGLVWSVLVLSPCLYFVGGPGVTQGDPLLALIFMIDLLALAAALVTVSARTAWRDRRVALALVGVNATAAIGDGLASAGQSGQIVSASWATALLWAAAGYLIALASELARQPAPARRPAGSENPTTAAVWWRIVTPLLAVLCLPGLALTLWLNGSLDVGGVRYFGGVFLLVLGLSFGRQAYLLMDNHRAVLRERGLRAEAVRRSEELEALTGLATTMTESLEEAPIMERGLGVLHLAARATSSALHIGPELDLRAAAGAWHSERSWNGDCGRPFGQDLQERGGRAIVRLKLSARGHEIGVVTALRAASSPFTRSELGLLQLLVNQLAIAVQNARDYREKLDQAIRDPLTGVYNRRFFLESLSKEVHRTERFGSTVSLVLFDVDNFKAINDTRGHSAGDEALRRIAAVVSELARATDSFARLGGEEFGLLLPETHQLDALVVAERMRTAIARSAIIDGLRITVSGGVASCPTDATTPDDLFNRADAALYWAKRNGKNLCAIAGEVVVEEQLSTRDTMLTHLHALVSTIDAQSLATRDHSENVSAYAAAIGQALGLEADHIVRLRRAAFLHDIGKVAVSRAILEKPGPLDDAEWEEMRIHPTAGATMLLHSGLVEEALWVRHHHERVDGRGYPDGLAGDDIPLESRILLVADAFEAMTSDRSYRRGTDVACALQELQRCRGTQFDAAVVDAMCRLVSEDQLAVLALQRT